MLHSAFSLIYGNYVPFCALNCPLHLIHWFRSECLGFFPNLSRTSLESPLMELVLILNSMEVHVCAQLAPVIFGRGDFRNKLAIDHQVGAFLWISSARCSGL